MSFVHFSESHHIGRVRLNRPDIRNAFNPDMINEITDLFVGFEQRKDLRAVTLSGEGKVFSAGADLTWMKTMVNATFEQNREDSNRLFEMFEAIARCPVPVVGLVHGAAFGGALGLIACCDHVVVEEGTQLCFSEAKLGIAPAVISAFVYKKIPPGFVRPLMMSGRAFGPAEALRMGLVHDVAPAGQGLEALNGILKSWCEAGPQATRAIKKLLNDLPAMDWAAQKDRTSKLIAELRVGSEGQEGLKSFLEKRSPSWRDQ